MKKTFKNFYVYVGLLIAVISFILGIFVGIGKAGVSSQVQKSNGSDLLTKENLSSNQDLDFKLYWDVWQKVKDKYVDKDKIKDQDLFYGSVRGIVNALNDPYSLFLTPAQARKFEEDLSGSFEGIGAEIGIKEGVLTVIAPLSESPSQKAGLRAGDKIFFIDKTDTSSLSIDEAVGLIRGPKGSEVVLTIGRDGLDKLQEIKIIRDTIEVDSVRWEKLTLQGKTYYYIKIISFSEDTKRELDKALAEVLKDKTEGLIIDLRNDPGGFLDLSISIASLWIEDGVVVSESYSNGQKNSHFASGPAFFKNMKTVVLVNEGSASAAEILSGALQDYGAATLVGKKTFGKGSVQTLEEFEDKSALKITVARWLTPKDRQIDKIGIEPDISVDYTEADFKAGKDPQLDKAKELIILSREKIALEIENAKNAEIVK